MLKILAVSVLLLNTSEATNILLRSKTQSTAELSYICSSAIDRIKDGFDWSQISSETSLWVDPTYPIDDALFWPNYLQEHPGFGYNADWDFLENRQPDDTIRDGPLSFREIR